MSQNQSAPASLNELVARIDAALPQTQCTRCGYPDCRSYAQAIASGDARAKLEHFIATTQTLAAS